MSKVYGGIEAGGTKFVCAVGRGPEQIFAVEQIPTTSPAETLGRTLTFFQQQEYGSLSAIGIASFGPLDPEPSSPSYGYITATPKPGWSDTDFVGTIKKAMQIPIGFDTDVNIAALGEWRWGAAQNLDTFLYLTIGTGIGERSIYRCVSLSW
jgi:fructokinase